MQKARNSRGDLAPPLSAGFPPALAPPRALPALGRTAALPDALPWGSFGLGWALACAAAGLRRRALLALGLGLRVRARVKG